MGTLVKNVYGHRRRVLCWWVFLLEDMRPYLLTVSNQFGREAADMFDLLQYDYAVDVRDTVTKKLLRIERAMANACDLCDRSKEQTRSCWLCGKGRQKTRAVCWRV